MLTTCTVCNSTSTGMISIYNHPNNLDTMLNFVSGHKVEEDDFLCIICYDELKIAFNFKQKCQQSPLYRPYTAMRTVALQNESSIVANEIPTSSGSVDRQSSALEENDAKISTTIVDEEEYSNEIDERLTDSKSSLHYATESTAGSHEDSFIVEVIDNPEYVAEVSDKDENGESQSSDREKELHGESDEGETENVDLIKCEHSIGKRGKRIPRDEHRKGPIPNYEEDDLFKNLGTTQCEYCFVVLDTYEERKEHELKHKEEDRPYRCNNEYCSARFKDRYSVRNHIRIHSDFKQYKCRFCDQRFHQRGNAKAHERCHTGEKPFVCPHCGKGFAEKGNLKSHIRFHTGERPYSCSHCSKTFRTHYSHKIHVRSHTQEKPFLCSDCGKSFNCSGKLRIHKRIHTGHRPYMCDLCGASFMDSSRLKRHSKIH